MLNFIETILITVFSVLPDAEQNSAAIATVNKAFEIIGPGLAKINLIFPIFSLFQILLLVLFVEMSLFLITFVLKMGAYFRG